MELNTYLGRAGTGKSYHMIKNIKQQMKENPLGDPYHFDCTYPKYVSIGAIFRK